MDGKIAFLFPGQGSQKYSMGLDLLDDEFSMIMEKKGINIKEILQDESLINMKASYAIFYTSYVLAKRLEKNNIIPDLLIGFSLGEITSVGFTRLLNEDKAIELLKLRTDSMNEACRETKGSMISVNQITLDEVNEEIKSFEKEIINKIYIANINSKKQTVISLQNDVLDYFINNFNKGKLIKLNVNGAFHSPLMNKAYLNLEKYLEKTQINKCKYKLMSNVLGTYYPEDDNEIKKIISRQVKESVKFMDMVNKAYEDGVRTFIEVGNGKTLVNLVKRIIDDKDIKLISVSSLNDIDELCNKFNEN